MRVTVSTSDAPYIKGTQIVSGQCLMSTGEAKDTCFSRELGSVWQTTVNANSDEPVKAAQCSGLQQVVILGRDGAEETVKS
jgi:hypothetical protein